jgi:hypothetical protein
LETLLPRFVQGGQEHGRQDADNRDYDQQFNKCKCFDSELTIPHFCVPPLRSRIEFIPSPHDFPAPNKALEPYMHRSTW